LVTMRLGTDIPMPRIRLRWVMRVGYHVASHEIERAAAPARDSARHVAYERASRW